MKIGTYLELNESELTFFERKRFFKQLTFLNGERNEVDCVRHCRDGKLQVSRGALALLPDRLLEHAEDTRVQPPIKRKRKLKFNKTLDYQSEAKSFEGQQDALDAMLATDCGIVVAQPGSGKSEIALAYIAEKQTPAIVIVHTKDIFQQWVERIESDIPNARIGKINDVEWTIGDITVAMIQTVNKNLDEFIADNKKFGTIVIDECHHSSARTWEVVMNNSLAYNRFGFTATQKRADGMEPLMKFVIGPVIYKRQMKPKIPTRAIPLYTDFKFAYRGRWDWMPLLEALVEDEGRNKLIASTALRQISKGHSVLVLSRRIEHLDLLLAAMRSQEPDCSVEILTAKVPKKLRTQRLDDFRAGKVKCLLATQLADEALDVPILSRVILSFPGKHDGRIIQQAGRALREYPDKTDAVIFDLVDKNIAVLHRQWNLRRKAYKEMKIKVKHRKGKETQYVTKAEQRRELANRLRERAASGH